MYSKKIKRVVINSGVNPNFIESTLTQDITTLEALYDLVDNSIDAARNDIFMSNYEKDSSGLPISYDGYKIQIRIDKDSVRILDNCLGIEEKTLTETALYTAATSNHAFGIGYYGLGLKRALLKMGTNFAFSVDNKKSIFKSRFTNLHLGGNKDKEIIGDEYQTKNKSKVLFSVNELKNEICNDLHDSRWFQNAVDGFAIRYGVYISKGFQIILHNVQTKQFMRIAGATPKLRKNALVPPASQKLNINGVEIVIESGIHDEYFFPGEEQYSLSKNRLLTDQFGIYFVCNDRIIVAASTAIEHGWGTKWHSEYNGFVCWVRFVSKEPHKLPWNTAKTALRVDSSLFLTVRDILTPVAEQYRREIKKRYSNKDKNVATTGQNPNASTSQNTSKPSETVQSNVKSSGSQPKERELPQLYQSNGSVLTFPNIKLGAAKNKDKHTKNWTTLIPKNFPITQSNEILNNILIEAAHLELEQAPHAACLLYRSILEASVKEFVIKTGNFNNVIDHYYSKGEGKKKNHSDEYKKSQGIDISIGLHWLLDNNDLYPKDNKKILHACVVHARKYLSKMNGVVHGNNIISVLEITTIRNETIHLLKFLVQGSVTITQK